MWLSLPKQDAGDPWLMSSQGGDWRLPVALAHDARARPSEARSLERQPAPHAAQDLLRGRDVLVGLMQLLLRALYRLALAVQVLQNACTLRLQRM